MFGNLYFYLNRHHTTAHYNNGDARAALASNFKDKMHSKQNLFAKSMTEMFALNCGLELRSDCQPKSDFVHIRMELDLNNWLSSVHTAYRNCSYPICVSIPSGNLPLSLSSPSLQNKDPGGGVGSTSRGWRLVGLGVEIGRFRGGDG